MAKKDTMRKVETAVKVAGTVVTVGKVLLDAFGKKNN